MQEVIERARRIRAHNEVIVPARRVLGDKQLQRLQRCGEVMVEVEREDPKGKRTRVWRQLHCGSRFCPICASREGYRRAEELQGRHGRRLGVVSTLATLTVGYPVEARSLPSRFEILGRTWRELWKLLKPAGCLGGVYSYEATIGREGKTHLHMHLWLEWDAESPFIQRDTRYCLQHRVALRDFTPAWLQWMAWCERALKKASPELWARLRPLDECWGKAGRYAHAREVVRRGGCDLPARFLSVDLGARFPGRASGKARAAGRHLPLTISESSPKEALKYIMKGMSGAPVQAMMELLRGRRRMQPFGVYARAEKDPPVELDLAGVRLRRLTGRVFALMNERNDLHEREMLFMAWQEWGMAARAGPGVGLKLLYAGPRYALWAWMDEWGREVDIPWAVA